jgi:histidyl-tRNA synthetase
MRQTVEKFGYVEYGASILEPTELYKAKTGEEIINEQTYSFKDRGDRDVTLRPEMTPTVARMIAHKKRELSFPLRWYSIPNLFRYEKPQKGRLREHWQLNVDLFGIENLNAEIEIITIASEIMEAFGAKDTDFEIRINSRKNLQQIIESKIKKTEFYTKAIKLLDKKDKMSEEDFTKLWSEISDESPDFEQNQPQNIKELIEKLNKQDINNVIYDPILARGFDYYTDIVFEIYDTNKENPRALFGGGRYNDLLDIFGAEKVPAIGFGMGDVTIGDFLKTRNLIPEYKPTATLYIAHAEGTDFETINNIAKKIRDIGVNTIVDITDKKVSDQIKRASKENVLYSLTIGEKEIQSGIFSLKNMQTGEMKELQEKELFNELRSI